MVDKLVATAPVDCGYRRTGNLPNVAMAVFMQENFNKELLSRAAVSAQRDADNNLDTCLRAVCIPRHSGDVGAQHVDCNAYISVFDSKLFAQLFVFHMAGFGQK